jgi:hypothetical protein
MVELTDRTYEDVYGITYTKGKEQMDVTDQMIRDATNHGFDSAQACAEFAHGAHADLIMYSRSGHAYLYVNHIGYPLKPAEWKKMYRSILFYRVDTDEGPKAVRWLPESYTAFRNSRINGEEGDGLNDALYYRDYHAPYGYYNEAKGCFNSIKPFKYFAKETGADTSFIYTFINHIAGVNAPYLLAWLRQKMCDPYSKTEVMPIFVGAQGTGKSTFGEVICKALFGEENVLVSHQYDSTARFNTDYVDALIISIEERMQEDRRNSTASLKSATTATHIRKEQKGIDPSYQKSFTEYIISTNDDVPLKFEDGADQRRFMIMEADSNFVRSNPLADEVFTKLYGVNASGIRVGPGLVDNREVVEQFKHELFQNAEIAGINPKEFERTDAFMRCFSIPRTNEAMEIETIAKSLAPFIQQSLLSKHLVDESIVTDEEGNEESVMLDDIAARECFLFKGKRGPQPDRIAICRPLVFSEQISAKPYAHSVVEKVLRSLKKWFLEHFGIELMANTQPPVGGFKAVKSRYKNATTAWFTLAEPPDEDLEYIHRPPPPEKPIITLPTGHNPRFNERYVSDTNGCFETLNPLPITTSERKATNCIRLDTFLLEADETTPAISAIEEKRLTEAGYDVRMQAEELYAERLKVQEDEAERLIKDGIVRRVVYSGAKSLHMLVTVSPAPQNLDERKWLDAHIKEVLGKHVTFDASTSDAARLTRYPYPGTGKVRVTHNKGYTIVGSQRVLYDSPDVVWEYNWRPIYEQWNNRMPTYYEQRGRKMLPAKPIFMEAAKAILEGTFFSDDKWNGKRNETFFPAYRLVRALGYSAFEVWEELEADIQHYYKPQEREYWRSRRGGNLIRSIDAEFDT